jgi:hypothetical protein
MSEEVLREFLVSLGWKIDQSGQRKFATSIAIQTEAVRELGEVIKETGKKVFEFTRKLAEGLESLYFVSQRTRAAAGNIQALGFAAGQMGSTAEAARASLEGLARFMRQNPGGEGIIRSLGVETRDVNGNLRDTSQTLTDLGKRFAQLPFYRANAYAQLFGIDEKTLIALREGVGQFSDEYQAMLKAAGVNSQGAAKASHEFMNQVRLLGAAFGILGQKIAQSLAGKGKDLIKKFTDWLVKHFDQITYVIGQVIDITLKMADIFSTMALRAANVISRVIDWFKGLDGSTKVAIVSLGGLLIAWKLLSNGILATPLGRLLAIGAAFLLIKDDYDTWKEGGKSLIPWGRDDIQQALAGLARLGEALKNLYHIVVKKIQLKFDISNLLDVINLATALVSGDWSGAKKIAQRMKQRVEVPDSQRTGLENALAGDRVKDNGKSLWSMSSLSGKTPRGIRNNNPGNINFVGQAGATKEANGPFAVWKTAQEGLIALARQLRLYAARGIDTISSIITTFAPPKDKNGNIINPTAAYIASVSKLLGNADVNKHLNLGDPGLLTRLMDSIIRVENGRNPYSMELLGAAAGGGTIPASKPSVVLHQTNTTTITGAGDPQATAAAVGGAQHTVNERLVRNLQGKIQ